MVLKAEGLLPAIENLEIPTRIIHMPLAWDDDAIQAVIQKSRQSVRADASWCPSKTVFNADSLSNSQNNAVPDKVQADPIRETDRGDAITVEAHVSGNVWKFLVYPGDKVEAETLLLILESMKMEFIELATASGTVNKILCKADLLVSSGQVLILLS